MNLRQWTFAKFQSITTFSPEMTHKATQGPGRDNWTFHSDYSLHCTLWLTHTCGIMVVMALLTFRYWGSHNTKYFIDFRYLLCNDGATKNDLMGSACTKPDPEVVTDEVQVTINNEDVVNNNPNSFDDKVDKQQKGIKNWRGWQIEMI